MGKKKKSKKKTSKVVQFPGRSTPDYVSVASRVFDDIREDMMEIGSFADFIQQEDPDSFMESIQENLIGELMNEMKGAGPNSVKKAMDKSLPILQFFFFLLTEVNEMTSEFNSRNGNKMIVAMNELEFFYTLQELSKNVKDINMSLERMPLAVGEELAGIYRYLIDNEAEKLDEFEEAGEWVKRHLLSQGYTEISMEQFDEFYNARSALQEGHMGAREYKEKTEEIRKLFRSEKDFKLFENSEDFSYGLTDMTDEEFLDMCDCLVDAVEDLIKNNVLEGVSVLKVAEPPSMYMESIPLIEGKWIHSKIAELLEFYACLEEEGYDLEEADPHPLALKVATELIDNERVMLDSDEKEEIEEEVRSNMRGYSGRKKQINGIEHFHIDDYLSWDGRYWEEDPEVTDGVVIRSWGSWVEENRVGEGAMLNGIPVSTLFKWVSPDEMAVTEENAAGSIQEERNSISLSTSSWIRNFFSSEKDEENGIRDGFFAAPYPLSETPARFRIASIYFVIFNIFIETAALNAVIQRIEGEYFHGKQLVFDAELEILNTILNSVIGLIFKYNHGIGNELDRLDKLSLIDFNDSDGEYSWGALFPNGYYLDLERLKDLVEAEIDEIMERLQNEAEQESVTFLDPIFEWDEDDDDDDDDDEQIPF